MALRNDLPRIAPDKAPSIFNGSMARGSFYLSAAAMIGIAGFFAFVAPATSPLLVMKAAGVFLGAQAVGGLVGGIVGKAQQQRELVEGRTVSDPTFINNTMIGATELVLALGAAIAIAGGLPTLISIGPIAATAAFVTAAVVGGIIGKQSMKQDFNRAIAQRDSALEVATGRAIYSPRLEQDLARGKAAYKDSVSAEESQALDAKMAAPKENANFTDRIAANRVIADQVLAK